MKLSQSFGQVFLKDKKYIDRILSCLDIEEQEVLEIGAGDGRISERILPKAKYLYCVEIDRRFCDLLRKKFSPAANLEIIQSDIIKFSFQDKFKPKQVVVFGNVPYQISNELIRYLVENRAYIKRAYLTFQKEFVSKLTASPSKKDYGVLSCYAQFYAKAEKLFDIPAPAWTPVPKVDSSFMKIDFYSNPPYEVIDVDFLFRLIRSAFSRRRKKIINSLPFSKDKIIAIFSSLNLSADARPENFSLDDYVKIANNLYKIRIN